MSRDVCIIAADGYTGLLIAEVLTDEAFEKELSSVTGPSLKPSDTRCRNLPNSGPKNSPSKPGRLKEMVGTRRRTGTDTMCLIPPAPKERCDITAELIDAVKKRLFAFSVSAGCDLAEKYMQCRVRESIELESLVSAAK
ncbi:hypothetical protein H2201_009147, partial [Coniosporium apollinis]